MHRRLLITAIVGLLALSALSCATEGLTPSSSQMPAASAGLPPDERFFSDALVDYGDWVLIEPYGWVFQPRVNWLTWRPYEYGFWAPTDLYGWTWISAEPFGWATFHYGQWMYDRFQGWVWIPGLDWGPAWVAWRASDEYIGWAPLMPQTSYYAAVPGGAFLYVPTQQLVATDLSKRVMKEESVAHQLGRLTPVTNVEERGGVRINLGPPIEQIEHVIGARIPRVKLEDRSPVTAASAPHSTRAPKPAGAPANDNTAAVRRAGEETARQARDIAATPSRVPDRMPVVRPMPSRHPAKEAPKGDDSAGAGGGPDTTSAHSAPDASHDRHGADPPAPGPPRQPRPAEKPASRDTSG